MSEKCLYLNFKRWLPLLIGSLLIGLFCSSFTGAYRYDFYYQIKVVNSKGEIVTGKDFTIQKESSSFIVKTDAQGVLNIHLGGTENCPSHSRRIKDWSWTPSSLRIITTNSKIDINKNWKKHFKHDEKKIDVFNYESGKLSWENRK